MAFPNTHFLAYADDMGMSVLHAANTISVTAIFSILGSVLLGLAADRYRRTSVLGADLCAARPGLPPLASAASRESPLRLRPRARHLLDSHDPAHRRHRRRPLRPEASRSHLRIPLHLHESRLRVRVLPRRGDLRGDRRLPARPGHQRRARGGRGHRRVPRPATSDTSANGDHRPWQRQKPGSFPARATG